MNEAPLRILFVDDEERIVTLLRTIFHQSYEVHIATSADEAMKIIMALHIHVIVSDQRMPGMLGIELLSKVRLLSPNTMRILLTGYSDLAAIVGSVNDGEVFRYINKPWDHTEIKEIIAQAAEIARNTARAPAALPPSGRAEKAEQEAPAAAILVIDDNRDVINSISAMFQNVYGVYGASNIAQAIEILEKHDISVIITDTHVNNEDTTELLRVLKTQYPLIIAILLTEAPDAETVIKLINQVQIFRCATKPIRRGALQLSVKAAINQNVIYKNNPALLARHAVPLIAETAHNQALKISVMNSVRALRGRAAYIRE